MKPWCGHADGIESVCEHVVVPIGGEKFLFVRVRVWCNICKMDYRFPGEPVLRGQVPMDAPFLQDFPSRLCSLVELDSQKKIVP